MVVRVKRLSQHRWFVPVVFGLALGVYTSALLMLAADDPAPVVKVAKPVSDPRIPFCHEALDTADAIVDYSGDAARLANEALDALAREDPDAADAAASDLASLQAPLESELNRYVRTASRCRGP